ncbi:MAG TPA: LysR substrate-binding domain-containing protein, partial [Caulobacteraceae bacterium]|nr:LysR substrate-binding domain-containing protein [Caulobacteraceae bacterium]
HPSLRIELAANPAFLSPSRREVDMAITLSPPPDPRLVVESLTPYQLALYASPGYVAREGAPATVADLARRPVVGYVQDLIFAPELRYLDEIAPDLVPALASSSIQAQRAIIAADGGVGVLPCFLADGLVRVLPDRVLIERQFWLCTHRDVQASARMRAVARWLRALVEGEGARLAPFRSPAPAT